MEMNLRSSRIHSPSYAVVSPLGEQEESPFDEYQDSSVFQNLSKPTSEYCQPVQVVTEPKTARVCQSPDSQDDSHYEVPVTLAQAQAREKARLSTVKIFFCFIVCSALLGFKRI